MGEQAMDGSGPGPSEARFTYEAHGRVWVGVDRLTGERCPHRHRNRFVARDCLSPAGAALLRVRVRIALEEARR
jgi:hypothetical protein